jgi:hypothetical protein
MPIVVTLAFVLSVAGTLYAIREWILAKRLALKTLPVGQFWVSLITASVASLTFSVMSLFGPPALTPAVAAALALVALFEAADLVFFRYFDDGILDTLYSLPVHWNLRGIVQVMRAYCARHFPLYHFLTVLSVLLAAFLTAELAGWLPLSPVAALASFSAAVFARQYLGPRRAYRQLLPIEQAFLAADDHLALHLLQLADRRQNVVLLAPPRRLPHTVLVVINESAGAYLPSSTDPNVLLADRLRALSGTPHDWFVPTNAIANSSCTDISIPSLLTGSGSHEGFDKIHRLPFVFDLAKARGYRTAFFTSSTLNFANFSEFFAGADIDEMVTAETIGTALVNDLCIDDYIPALKLADCIKQTTEPLFAVLYINALHFPFQLDSICGIPASVGARRNRAIFLAEEIHQLLFEALHASARYDDALVISVGDHGEVLDTGQATAALRMTRLIQLSDAIVRPLFLLKPPKMLPTEMSEALARNRDALIANIDIAPTLAHLFGTALPSGLQYSGLSFFDHIPRSRAAYVLNTNEWRSWPRSAAAVFRGTSSLRFDYLNDDPYRYENRGPAKSGADRDDLFSLAFAAESMRAAIARIYRHKLGRPRAT